MAIHSLVMETQMFTRVFQLFRPFLCTGPDVCRLDAPLVGECKHLVAGQKGRVKHVSEGVVWSQVSDKKMLHFTSSLIVFGGLSCEICKYAYIDIYIYMHVYLNVYTGLSVLGACIYMFVF